jgi:hypothetical protein
MTLEIDEQKSIVYDESLKYCQENNLTHLDTVRFITLRLNPDLTTEETLELFIKRNNREPDKARVRNDKKSI